MIPDLAEARRFLELLDPDAERFTFQTFDDSAQKRGHLAKVLHGSLDELAPDLIALQKAGAGIFVTVNETDGKGRKAENITRTRAVFADLDGSPVEPAMACSLAPHVVVESSPGRFHAYWLAHRLHLNTFAAVQKCIATRFGGDKAVHDLPRVMRLPGFTHQKGKPFLTRIVQANKRLPYEANEILNSPLYEHQEPEPAAQDSPKPNGRDDDPLDLDALRRSLTGETPNAWHAAMLAMVAHLVSKGAEDWFILDWALKYRWHGYSAEATRSDVQKMIAGARAKGFGPQQQEADDHQLAEHAQAQFMSWPDLDGRKAPSREFILSNWIPARCVTLLHGFGGVGKSLLAQQVGTAGVIEAELLGATIAACPVLAWWGEDDHDEIWRRQENINATFGVRNLADLDGKLIWRPCPGDDVTLFTAANESDFRTTPLFTVLRDQIGDLKAELAIIDSAAQIAAIPENNRPLVTRCMQALTKLCIDLETSIILIGHNNRDGDYSGSSAWENRARSRLHMKRDKNPDGTDTIKLCRPKANYAGVEAGVALEWHQGAYRCTDQRFETFSDRLEREMREGKVDQAFLDGLDKLADQRRATSISKSAANYAPKLIAEIFPEFSKPDLERAMSRLFEQNRIQGDVRLWQRGNRAWVSGLGRKI
jgi:RecA-family ATPase